MEIARLAAPVMFGPESHVAANESVSEASASSIPNDIAHVQIPKQRKNQLSLGESLSTDNAPVETVKSRATLPPKKLSC